MSPSQSTTRPTPPPPTPTTPGHAAGDAAVTALIAPPAPAAEMLHLLRLLAARGPRERALLEALSAALRHRDLLAHPYLTAARHSATAPVHRLPADDLPALAGSARTRDGVPDDGNHLDDLDDLVDLVDWPATVAAAAQEVQDRLRDVEDAYRRPPHPAQRPRTDRPHRLHRTPPRPVNRPPNRTRRRHLAPTHHPRRPDHLRPRPPPRRSRT